MLKSTHITTDKISLDFQVCQMASFIALEYDLEAYAHNESKWT